MKINEKNNNEMPLRAVHYGTVFCLNNLYYIKCFDIIANNAFAVNLETGEKYDFNKNVLVKTYPDAELNIIKKD